MRQGEKYERAYLPLTISLSPCCVTKLDDAPVSRGMTSRFVLGLAKALQNSKDKSSGQQERTNMVSCKGGDENTGNAKGHGPFDHPLIKEIEGNTENAHDVFDQ